MGSASPASPTYTILLGALFRVAQSLAPSLQLPVSWAPQQAGLSGCHSAGSPAAGDPAGWGWAGVRGSHWDAVVDLAWRLVA